MTEHVDDYLDHKAPGIAGEYVVKAIVRRYREAVTAGDNAAATVLGELMLEVAKPFGDLGDPEYRDDWKP